MTCESFELELAEAFATETIKQGDIRTCDSCESYMLKKHSHTYNGSMGTQYSLCPECDLPVKWHSKFSKSRKRRYYVYLPSHASDTPYVQWGHPTEGNPLHVPEDKGYMMVKRKKQKTSVEE